MFVLVVAARRMNDSNEDFHRGNTDTELQQLLTLLDLICKLTNLQWNKDLMKILHQCKEAADLREASLYER